jgi:putative acetyltransferase
VSADAIERDDPRRPDVVELLQAHLDLMHSLSPPEDCHALDLDGLTAPDIAFFSLRDPEGNLLGIGALKELSPEHVELKSMHTIAAARGRGLGRAMLDRLLAEARARGAQRVSLETGSMDGFIPARTLYASAGFELTDPFGDYVESPNSTFMTLALSDAEEAAA